MLIQFYTSFRLLKVFCMQSLFLPMKVQTKKKNRERNKRPICQMSMHETIKIDALFLPSAFFLCRLISARRNNNNSVNCVHCNSYTVLFYWHYLWLFQYLNISLHQQQQRKKKKLIYEMVFEVLDFSYCWSCKKKMFDFL